jgi:hypothetical protein
MGGCSDAAGAESLLLAAKGLFAATVRLQIECVFAAAGRPGRGADVVAAVWRASIGRGHSVAAKVTCLTSPSRSRFWPRVALPQSTLLASLLLTGAAVANDGDASACDAPTLPRMPSCFLTPRDLVWTGGGGMVAKTFG